MTFAVIQESRVHLQTFDASQRRNDAGPCILPADEEGRRRLCRQRDADGIRELEMRVREIFPVTADVFRKELGTDVAPPATDAATFIQSIFDEVAENLPQKVLIVEQVSQASLRRRFFRCSAFGFQRRTVARIGELEGLRSAVACSLLRLRRATVTRSLLMFSSLCAHCPVECPTDEMRCWPKRKNQDAQSPRGTIPPRLKFVR